MRIKQSTRIESDIAGGSGLGHVVSKSLSVRWHDSRPLKGVRKKTIQLAAEILLLLGAANISCKDLEAEYLGVFESQ